MGKLGSRIFLGIPTLSSARRSTEWIDAVFSMQYPLGSSVARGWVEDMSVAEARNRLAMSALEQGADYLVFVSDDVLPPPNMILQMLDKIGREFPVEGGQSARASMVTGVYWTKTTPPEPYLWNGLLQGTHRDWKVGEFFPVDFAGCDALMIETAMLRELPQPWFSTDWVWEADQRVSSIATEDFYFYTKARERGFRLFADTSIQCLHEDRFTGRRFGLTVDMRQAGGAPDFEAEDVLRVAELGVGLDSPAFGDNCEVVTFDGRAEVRPDYQVDLAHIPENHLGQYDVVHARHVLEHFSRREAPKVMRHWATLLKFGGRMVIRVPNLDWALKTLADSGAAREAKAYAWDQLYGGQHYDADFHRNGFTARKLQALLETTEGLAQVTVVEEDDGQNLKAEAYRVPDEPREALADAWERIAPPPAAEDAVSPPNAVGLAN